MVMKAQIRIGEVCISIEGDEEYVSTIASLLQNNIPDSIILKHPVQLHAVYNGNVVHVNHERIFLLLI